MGLYAGGTLRYAGSVVVGLDARIHVNPGSVRTFYQARRVLLIAACVAPVIILAGAWWVVNTFVLAPAIPGPSATPDELVEFVIHDKGLPRLDQDERLTFLTKQAKRIATDKGLSDRFARALRTASPEEQLAFRSHLFDTFKPLFLGDARRFLKLEPEAQQAYLDERIVAYNRLSITRGEVAIDPDALGSALPNSTEALQMVMEKTTEEERQTIMAYGVALRARVEEILGDPELKAEFEARIGEPVP